MLHIPGTWKISENIWRLMSSMFPYLDITENCSCKGKLLATRSVPGGQGGKSKLDK